MADDQLKFEKDLANKRITVTRHFNAPVEDVWRAWTEAELLDQWWAPKPWLAVTKAMDFTQGGQWLYAMTGPEGDKQWCKLEYEEIDPVRSFSARNGFCDENGNFTDDLPQMKWVSNFATAGDGSEVVVEITFDKVEDLEKIIEMGFKEGFIAALGNLDELVNQK
ncbi:MAG: SRPBCC domain-containing protein [Taibaiella sp.]|nr:SRPBCC domain-containing protein [Taibaiella sp.]